jgi:hypothetical protein
MTRVLLTLFCKLYDTRVIKFVENRSESPFTAPFPNVSTLRNYPEKPVLEHIFPKVPFRHWNSSGVEFFFLTPPTRPLGARRSNFDTHVTHLNPLCGWVPINKNIFALTLIRTLFLSEAPKKSVRMRGLRAFSVLQFCLKLDSFIHTFSLKCYDTRVIKVKERGCDRLGAPTGPQKVSKSMYWN